MPMTLLPSRSSLCRIHGAFLGLFVAMLPGGLSAADAAAPAPPIPQPAPAAVVPAGPPLTLPFTEDFESGDIRTDIWTPHEAGSATVKVVPGKGGFGKYVLQAHLPAMAQRAYALISTLRLPESVRGHFFGRAYMYITPNGPTRHTVLTYTGTAAWPSANWLEVGMFEGKFQLSYQQQDRALPQPDRGEKVAFGNPIPTGRWFCLEWEANDTPDTLTVWVDGEQVNSEVFAFKTFGNTGLVKGFAEVGFGVRVFGPVPEAYDIYYDNVAFDTKRIGPLKTAPAPMP
ncbi:MAG TPA: hypothetical protein VG838_11530 [Opitutaceae bacterium]|nr:hypothetical protein [Opitutaceae bacterium]